MEKKIEMNLTILDGTSRAQVIKAIRTYEETNNVNVITFFVASNHRLIMIEYDGIGVAKRYGNIEEFLLYPSYEKLELTCIL